MRILREQGAGKGFYRQADDGSQAKALILVTPEVFHHFGKSTSHELDIMHFIQVPHDIELHAAAEGFDEVACKTGAAAAQPVDDADAGFQPGGNALPLQSVVEESVAVVECYVERSLSFSFFTHEKVLRSCQKVFCPEESSPFGFQTQDAIKRIGRELRERGERGIERADEGMLVVYLGEEQIRSQLGAVARFEITESEGGIRIHIAAAGQ